MDKKTFIAGVIAICVSIIVAAFIMRPTIPRYCVTYNDNHIVIFDNEEHKMYDHYLPSMEGPTDWQEIELP